LRSGEQIAIAIAMTSKEHTLSVLTYNIHSCVGADGKYSVERVAHVLKQANADIVCLQEVEVNSALQTTRIWSTGHADDQPALLAQMAGYLYYKFAKAITCVADKRTCCESFGEGDGEFGVAILSKWPIQEHTVFEFSPFYKKTPRNLLACNILTPAAGKIWVLCTHLGCHYRGGEQLQQAKELRAFIESLLQEMVVLGGDLNSLHWFAAVKELKKVLIDSGGSNMGTFPSLGLLQGSMKLDYIFHDSNMICCSTNVYVDGAVASDHRAFSASLQIVQKLDDVG
jgi:endonuclease/exonuclease/phosphatase family metal-dependent hydrolase